MATALILYLCLFTAGFVFLIAGFIFGGEHDGDHDHDHDHDSDDGDDGKGSLSPSVFSFKGIACFLIGFGLGATLSHFFVSGEDVTSLKVFLDTLFGVLGGFAFGYCGWLIIKLFMSQTAHSNFSVKCWIGVEAPLTLTIQGETCGEMQAAVDGQIRSLDVRAEDGGVIKTSTLVRVIRVDGQIGIVRKV